ncbi:hypothetical protein T492DRAFT_971697, partial [Pavlovales sp. CCMP2436]
MALAPLPRELLIRQARAQEVVSLRSVLVFLVFGGPLSLSYPGRYGLNRVRWSRVHLPLLGRGPIIAVRCVVGVDACCKIIRSIYTLNHGQTACRLSLSPVTRCVCVCVCLAGGGSQINMCELTSHRAATHLLRAHSARRHTHTH